MCRKHQHKVRLYEELLQTYVGWLGPPQALFGTVTRRDRGIAQYGNTFLAFAGESIALWQMCSALTQAFFSLSFFLNF
ncbi:hypothetical protein BU24DRAFT_417800 [Aaosphaeria arxii CBS 175.79]|uniref:Uncharacterized protein n=1 Tax=Aaosphaeria arxii CBS 175.79 TaxID=1450172 RepID=A0A6A5Y9X5_9PLEO|nr:uncharacterized protein BU24DRAFT_417800 [Aaosphaeria arxii CBS 175.79]KAF2022139.1 hypothetical protein BU24DRAFT_417800 [Aaosphaeria arxii CBS 175.79]